jgi:hypothetical protein
MGIVPLIIPIAITFIVSQWTWNLPFGVQQSTMGKEKDKDEHEPSWLDEKNDEKYVGDVADS